MTLVNEEETSKINSTKNINNIFNQTTNIDTIKNNKLAIQNNKLLLEFDNLSNKVDYLNSIDENNLDDTTFIKLSTIKQHSDNSEFTIRTITDDIKNLNIIKSNLSNSMTTLKQFQLLVNLTTQLDYQLSTHSYSTILKPLQDLNTLSNSLSPLARVPRVADVLTHAQMTQAKLRDQLVREFKNYWSSSLPNSLDMGGERQRKIIKDSTQLIDNLGDQVKHNIIEWFISYILRDYRRIFSPSDEAGQLDNIRRRFAWFNRIIKQFQDQQDLSSIWPVHWNVKSQLLAKFTDYTSQDIKIVLNNSKPNVDSLIEAIRITKDFESQMEKKLNLEFNDQGEFKSISIVYQNVFHVYISHQDKSLADIFSNFNDSTSQQFGEEESSTASVLESSSELFLNYRQILSQCATLTNGKPIIGLSKLYSKWLKAYANDILKPKLIHGMNSRRSLDSKVNHSEIRIAGLIINTADYCLSTAAQLEEKLKEYVYTSFKDQISFEEEGEIFSSIISNCLQRCLHNFELGIEIPLNDMSRIQWSQIGNSKKNSNNVTSVSNPSKYITDLAQSILNLSSNVRQVVDQRKYYRSFLDKAVSLSIALLTRNIVKARPLSSLGVEQLLLDLQTLRQAFLDSMESPRETGSTTSAYARHVNRAFIPLETLLKVVLAPSVPAEAFVQSYTTLIADNSSHNFQKVLEMKGLTKKDQSQLHEIFKAVTSTESQSELNSTSFLTELDMDPSNRPLIPVPSINTNLVDRDSYSSPDSITNINRGDSKNNSPAVPMFSDFKKLFLRK